MERFLVLLYILCTFFEGFWLVRLLDLVFECSDIDSGERKLIRRYLKWILVIIYPVALIVFVQLEATSQYAFIIALLTIAIPICAICRCDFISVISVIGFYELVLLAVKLIYVSLFGLLGGVEIIMSMENGIQIYKMLFLIISGSIWFVISFVFTIRIDDKDIKYRVENIKSIKNINIVGFLGLTFLSVAMFLSMRMHMDTFMFTVITTFVVCVVIIHVYTKYNMMMQQLKAIEDWNGLLVKNYENISDSYTSQAKLYHDMHRHFRIIRHMLEKNDFEGTLKYVDSLEKSIEIQKKNVFTGVDIIDVILSEKEKLVNSLGKKMTIKASLLPSGTGIELKDMCIIFANLLDNAVESADQEITITIKNIHKMILFKIENDFKVEPKKKNGIFITSKKDKLFHGWGIKSVESIVKRYDGHMDCKVRDKKFSVDIILNMVS